MSEKLTKYLTPVVALFFATALGVTASSTIGTDITTEGEITTPVLNVAAGMVISSVLSVPTINVIGDTQDMKIDNTGGGNILIEASAGGEVTLVDRVRLQPVNSEPIACGAGTTGTIFYNNTNGYLCVCDGTNHVKMSDEVTICSFAD